MLMRNTLLDLLALWRDRETMGERKMGEPKPIEKTDQVAVEGMPLPGDEEELLLAAALTATLEAYWRYVGRDGSKLAEPPQTGVCVRNWQLMARWEQLHRER